ncbi:SDR family NAD(P)-dependent oxidoreductase [Nocardia iowensis]|nr:SDR family NAD(P)-dependent oxidoreductase [Nocardia iowensis]
MTVTVITGANKGLGFETARQLVAAGNTVYVGARNLDKAERAAGQLGAPAADRRDRRRVDPRRRRTGRIRAGAAGCAGQQCRYRRARA